MAAGRTEMPLLTSVDQSDTLAEGSSAFRMDGCYYVDDEPHQDDITINDISQDKSESEFLDWADDYVSRLYGGLYIEDDVKARLFRVIYTQPADNDGKGYSQLKGRLEAHILEKHRLSLKEYNRTVSRVSAQINEIRNILDPLLDSLEIDEADRPARVDEVVSDIREEYSGDHNKTKRSNEVKRLRTLRLGESALKHAA